MQKRKKDVDPDKPRPAVLAAKRASSNNRAKPLALAPSTLQEQSALDTILQILLKSTRMDFSHYRQPTVLRRIWRRISMSNKNNYAEYLAFLENNPFEVDQLYDDLLLSHTEFFRDPVIFDELKKHVFPQLLELRPAKTPIRIWVAGCSSGEEVYSLAISIHEYLTTKKSIATVQFFGTDLNERHIAKARKALYSNKTCKTVSKERLARYFDKTPEGLMVTKQIREMCVFAVQDVTQDPPFPSIDLVSCRNVLIYFDATLQDIVVPLFHFALKPHGFLLLGSSESMGKFSEMFSPINQTINLYAKRFTRQKTVYRFPSNRLSTKLQSGLGHTPVSIPPQQTIGCCDISKQVDALLLNTYSPPCLVVDANMHIRQFRGDTSAFLTPSPGEASLKISKMTREGLMPDMYVAIEEAKKKKGTITKTNITYKLNSTLMSINLSVTPITDQATSETCFLIAFEKPAAPLTPEENLPELPGAENRERNLLRKELRATKEHLQSIVEEKDEVNQELWAANEEIQSTNEELQSVNEEMEAAKEELESSNEELIAQGEELYAKNRELQESEEKFRGTFDQSPVGSVMVGLDNKFIRCNAAFCGFLGYSENELVGKTISDITFPDDVNIALPEMKRMAEGSLKSFTAQKRYVRKDGRIVWGEISICMVCDYNNKPLFFLPIILDFTQRKHIEHLQKVHHDLILGLNSCNSMELALEYILKAGGLLECTDCGGIYIPKKKDGSLDLVLHFGLSREFISAVSHLTNDSPQAQLIADGKPHYGTHQDILASSDPLRKKEGLHAFAVIPVMNRTTLIAVLYLSSHSNDSIPENTRSVLETMAFQIGTTLMRILSDSQVRESKENFRILFDENPLPMALSELPTGKITLANKQLATALSKAPDDIIGKTANDLGLLNNPDDLAKLTALIIGAGYVNNVEVHKKLPGGMQGTDLVFMRLVTINDKKYCLTVIQDITDRKRTEEALQNAQKLESLGILAGGIAHDFNNLMGGIFGYIDLAKAEPDKNISSSYLSKATSTIDRARGLTMQLLTFAKGGVPNQKITPLFPFVQETAQFALSGSNVSATFMHDKNLWACNIDKNQIGQAIDNIVINAQQAMPAGGTIEITATNISFQENQHNSLAAGNYVKLSITDRGMGISPETLPRIFDPFYTTKANGHGLGLATSYSIINRHGGCIDVSSVQGCGSTFHIFFPASVDAVFVTPEKPATQHKGYGTILIMDDEDVIRETYSEMLKSLGYKAVCKANGKEAIEFFSLETSANRPIAAMILDLTVPGGMGGSVAIKELRKINATIPIFVSSGYADDPIMINPEEYGFTASLCKPFMIVELTQMLEKFIKLPG